MTKSRKPETLLPFSDDGFAKTLTTNGGQGNSHPEGGRHYSIRELACLQRFPDCHKFPLQGITEMKRMVGNAVPPVLAKVWFEEVVKSLRQSDKDWDAQH